MCSVTLRGSRWWKVPSFFRGLRPLPAQEVLYAHAEDDAGQEAGDAVSGTIIVTARRQSETLAEVPTAITVFTADTLEKTGDTQFAATVTSKVGPVKAKFKGEVTLSDLDPPNGYTITGEGKGGAQGFGRGSADVTLEEDGEATVLTYSASLSVGGKLAQVGSRLVVATTRKLADQFFTEFATIAGAMADGDSPVTESLPEAEDDVTDFERRSWAWYLGAALVVIAFILFLLR